MTQYGFHFDGTRCTGCKTCVLACKDKNNLPNDINFRVWWRHVEPGRRGLLDSGHLHLPRIGGLQSL